MTRKVWIDIEVEILQAVYPDRAMHELVLIFKCSERAIYAKAAALGLKKSAVFLASPISGRLRPGARLGGDTRFKPGNVPVNKGCKHRPGWAPGRMAVGQFQKGQVSGKAKQLLQPIGAERLSKEGYLQRKINNDMPMQSRWRAVHILEWEAVNGPLPKGHCLCFRDSDKTHIALDNLELITRAENMARNTLHRYPKPIARLIQLRGVLNRRIHARERQRDAQPQSQGSQP